MERHKTSNEALPLGRAEKKVESERCKREGGRKTRED